MPHNRRRFLNLSAIGVASAALAPAAQLYRGGVALRRWAYRAGIFATQRAPIKVVSIGNLTVGGTGKTPMVIALLERLKDRNGRIFRSAENGSRLVFAPLPPGIQSAGGLPPFIDFERMRHGSFKQSLFVCIDCEHDVLGWGDAL